MHRHGHGEAWFSLILYIFFFLRQGLELTSSVRLASEPQGSSCLRLSVLALQMCVAAAPGFFYVVSGGLDSGPHALVATT